MENLDEPELLARRFELNGAEITRANLAKANCDNPEALEWIYQAEPNEMFGRGSSGVTVRRVE